MQSDFNWLLQEILAHWFIRVLGIAGGAALPALLALRKSRWAAPIAYGLFGLVLTSVFFFTLDMRNALVKTASASAATAATAINTDNIEANVRAWLDTFNFGVAKLNEDPQTHFVLAVTTKAGRKLSVKRTKALDQHLAVTWTWVPPVELQQRLDRMPTSSSNKLASDLRIEMARYRTAYANLRAPLKSVYLERIIPITPTLTEDTFINTVNEVELASILALETVARAVGSN